MLDWRNQQNIQIEMSNIFKCENVRELEILKVPPIVVKANIILIDEIIKK